MAEKAVYIAPPPTIQSKVLSVVLGAGATAGLIMVGRLIYFKWLSNSEQLKAANMDSTASYAQKIRMAFDNDGMFGTDMPRLRQVITDIPSREFFLDICDSYARLYPNESLMRDMKSELQSSEYEEITDIIAAKPLKTGGSSPMNLKYVNWARRLRAAFDKSYGPLPGTDDKAVKQVFLEIPSRTDYEKVKEVYRKLIGGDLDRDYDSELQFWDHDYRKDLR